MIDHCCTALSPHYESNLTHITAPIRESNLQTKTVKMGKGVYERTSFYLVNQLPYKYIYIRKKEGIALFILNYLAISQLISKT